MGGGKGDEESIRKRGGEGGKENIEFVGISKVFLTKKVSFFLVLSNLTPKCTFLHANLLFVVKTATA